MNQPALSHIASMSSPLTLPEESKVPTRFPDKLYAILELIESTHLSPAISWLPNGHAFAINDEHMFVNNLLPRFFKATKLRSFQRQLNIWGFSRITSGHKSGTWWHESFVRGSPSLLKHIVRTGVKVQEPNVSVPKSIDMASNSSSVSNLRTNNEKDVLTIEEVCSDGREQSVSPLSSMDDARPFALERKVKELHSPMHVQEAGNFLDIAPLPLHYDKIRSHPITKKVCDWNNYPPNSDRDDVSLIQSNTAAMLGSCLHSPTRTSCNSMVCTTPSQGTEQMKNPFYYSQCNSGSLQEGPNQYPQREESSHGIQAEDDEFSVFIENMIQLT